MASNDTGTGEQKQGRANRRRQYVVNAAFQWKYTITLAITVFVLSSVLSTVLYGVLHQRARMRAMNPEGYVAEVGSVILLFGIGFALVAALGLGVWSFFMTHRICGPLFVLHRYIEELCAGPIPTPRNLRRKDEFKDIYASFTTATETLRRRKESELAVLTEAEATLQSAMGADAATCGPAIATVAGQLEELRRRAAGGGGAGPGATQAA
ncbi:MAG: hypothetical protein ACE5EX_06025, partial [Phycisphaerae bacterium]